MSELLTSQVLHEQLSVIMAALSKAAVLDICELLERALVGLRDEVSRSQRENRELRSRLNLIESVVVRGSLGPASPEDAREQPAGQRDHQGGQADEGAAVSGEQSSDVVLIKDEDSDCEEEDAMLTVTVEDVMEDAAVTPPPPSRRRRRKGQNRVADRKCGPAGTLNIAAVYSLDVDDDVAVGGHSESVAHPSEHDAGLPAADQLPCFPDAAQMAPYSSNNWNEPVSDDDAFAGDGPAAAAAAAAADNTFALRMVSGATGFTWDRRDGDAAAGKGRRHACGTCGKTYATAQNRDVHTRIHTGERPFGCQQCGKRFTQSAHLKSHLSIHTGRPHACPRCPRTFLTKYSLKVHLRKRHADT
ncbi:uncharacterized protein LOC144013382 [Festucalex cinctus]